jgi:hypothetical protein
LESKLSLFEIAVTARDRGGHPDLEIFLSISSPETVQAAWILSISVALLPHEVAQVAAELWEGDFTETLTVLGEWSFVQKGSDGWRISAPLAKPLAEHFKRTAPQLFQEAHQRLARLEEIKEADSDDDEAWFVRGRLAYYLAALDAAESVGLFGQEFAQPPLLNRTANRKWLTDLVLRQEYLLGSEGRAVDFYRGFRLYTTGGGRNRLDALDHFVRVFDAPEEDVYSAIALHLAGVIERDTLHDLSRSIDHLETSVGQSARLGIRENELFATHSLSWTLIASAGQHPDEAVALLARARSLATRCLSGAQAYGDVNIETWARQAAAVAEWLEFQQASAKLEDRLEAANRLVQELRDVEKSLLAFGDLESALLAANQAASIWRDVGRGVDALREISEAINLVWSDSPPAMALNRLAKTAGSLLRLTLPARKRKELAELIRKINQMLE